MSGKINSGKNAAYDLISDILGETNVDRAYFAQALKDQSRLGFNRYTTHLNKTLEEIRSQILEFNVSDEELEEVLAKIDILHIEDHNWYEDKTDSTRILLQSYGTDMVRNNIDSKYWAKQTAKAIQQSHKEYIVITDFRYPDEYIDLKEAINNDSYEYYPILIERDAETDVVIASHESENALNNFNEYYATIDNNHTLEETKDQLQMLLSKITSIGIG